MTSHNGEIVVDIKDIYLYPDGSVITGCSTDGTTSYRLKLCRDALTDLIEQVSPLAEGRCPRCDFEEALSVLNYAGEYIRSHFTAEAPGQLSESEVAILELAQAWAADDAITRCLNGDVDREH